MYNENMLLREMRICNMKRESVIMKKKTKQKNWDDVE